MYRLCCSAGGLQWDSGPCWRTGSRHRGVCPLRLPQCKAAKAFLNNELQRERPAVRIVIYDVAEDSAARQRLATLAAERSIANIGVPTFQIGTELIVGLLSAETKCEGLRCAARGISLSIPESAKPGFMRACAASFRLRTSPGRWLKQAGGVVMAGLGAVLLLHPKWLI